MDTSADDSPKRLRRLERKQDPIVSSHLLFKKTFKYFMFFALIYLLLSGLVTIYYLTQIADDGIMPKAIQDGERQNLLIIGTDRGDLGGGQHMIGRSDVMMLYSYDPDSNTALLVSLPRDTLVDLVNIGQQKLNAANVFGGTGLTLSTIEHLIGQPIHHYLKVDLDAFGAIIEAAGGVYLEVEQDMQYSDPYADPPLLIDLQQGYQWLNGEKAEQYVRYRDELGDIGRVERQKKITLYLVQKMIQPWYYWRFPFIAKETAAYAQSNLNIGAIGSYAWQFITLAEPITKEVLPGEGSYDGAYWLPDYQMISELFVSSVDTGNKRESLFNFQFDLSKIVPKNDLPSKEEISIIVLNGNGGPGTATRAGELFKQEGYKVVDIGDADDYSYLKSVIIFNVDAEDKARVMLSSLPGAELREADYENPYADLEVIIGRENVR